MGTRARSCVLAWIVVADLVAGCGGPRGGGLASSASGGPSGTVRRGQTGKLADVPATPSFVYLSGGPPPGNFLQYLGIPLVPMVVTESPADEEFWELEYRFAIATFGGVVDDTFHHEFILGARARCETQRDIVERNAARDARCLGPHYLKRTGPPEALEPRRGENR
jgi:hypothetical protein